MEFHFVLYYLDVTDWIPCHDWFAPEFVNFMANPISYLYRHISVLFAFSSGSLEYHWLLVLPFGWFGKYLKRNRYVQILTGIMTKLLVVQPKVLLQELSPSNYTWSRCFTFAFFVGNPNYIPKTFIQNAFGPTQIYSTLYSHLAHKNSSSYYLHDAIWVDYLQKALTSAVTCAFLSCHSKGNNSMFRRTADQMKINRYLGVTSAVNQRQANVKEL
ncbi:LOW QUALITY PROTEIN: hypothetical protein Cgig2_025670 [Carnegiea gigantea]|uniref:Uncharacterized protein n=1 Tax=Carnegiea gigantea TaxID=171969 RepID=A0A9Q1JQ84_9CARY|nr:LOW QUALITY PROTEIN: hypothetical protein Cgig2_025670 [Carnegiea gigantea]